MSAVYTKYKDLLEAPVTPAYPVGYNFFINNFHKIMEVAEEWYIESHGHEPAETDIAHGLWRALNECERWKTLGRAFQDTWPLADYPVEPGPTPTPGWMPTREQVLKVIASFCSMRDSKGRVMFTDFIGRAWLDGDMDTVNDWIQRTLLEKNTHMVVGFQSGDYHDYWLKGFDFTGRENEWRKMLRYLLDWKIIPFIFYTNGDNENELNNLQYRMDATLEFKDASVGCMGFEMIGSRNPTISSFRWYAAMQQMRATLGKGAVLAMHVDPAERCTWASMRGDDKNEPVDGCYWKSTPREDAPDAGVWIENDDPSEGDEVGAMRMLTPDILAMQTRHYGNGPSRTMGDLNDTETWSGHLVEIADRFLPPGSIIPGLQRAVTGPDWFDRHPVRPILVSFETVCYEYAQDDCSEEQAIAASHRCRQIVPWEGCHREEANG